jgi:hypothetical protein
MKSGGRSFQGRGGPGNRNAGAFSSKFKKTLLKASEDIVFSVDNPWEGDRSTLKQLLKQILKEVNQDPEAVSCSEYVTGDYAWNEENQAYEIPTKFSLCNKVTPIPKTDDVHFTAKLALRKEELKYNVDMTKAKAIIYSIICRLCSPSFASEFAPFAREPYGCIQYLRDNYGTVSMSSTERINRWLSFIYFTINPQRRLAAERNRYKGLVEELNVDPDLQLALLRSLKKDGLLTQMVPHHLVDTIEYCAFHDYSLEDTWAQLEHADNDERAKGNLSYTQPNNTSNNKAKIEKVSSEARECINCGKSGHISRDCRAPCGYCNRPFHKIGQCRDRIRDEGNKKGNNKNNNNPKKPTSAKKKAKASESENDEQDPEDSPSEERASTPTKNKPRVGTKRKLNNALATLVQMIESKNKEDDDEELTGESEPEIGRINQIQYSQGAFKLGKPVNKPQWGLPIKREYTVRIARVYSDSIAYLLKLDSGADVHITPSMDNVTNIEIFTPDNPCPLRLETADGSILQCIGKGNMGEFLNGVYICPGAQTTLISLQELQNIGLGIVFPPLSTIREFGNNIGGLIYGDDSEILGTFSRTYECTVSNIHRTGHYLRWNNGGAVLTIIDGRTNLLVPPKSFIRQKGTQSGKRKRSHHMTTHASVSTHYQLSDSQTRDSSIVTQTTRGTPAVPKYLRSISQQYDQSLPQLFLRSHANHTLRVQRSLAPPVDVTKACVRGIFAYGLDNINTVQEQQEIPSRNG